MGAMLSLAESVFATVAFFDVLDFAPTAYEVSSFLYKGNYSAEEVKAYLEVDTPYSRSGDFISLPGRESLFALRDEKEIHSKKLMQKAHRWKFLFSFIPGIKGVAVCNNLAFGNASTASDIDLFIITQKNKLFVTRMITTLLFHFLGIRRHHKKIAGRFCLSFWISEDHLSLADLQLNSSEDPYFAFWLNSLKPIYGFDVIQNLLSANAKILKEYFPSHAISSLYIADDKQSVDNAGLFETLMQKYQLSRIHKKIQKLGPKNEPTGNIATPYVLKFHDRDRRGEFFAKWQNVLHGQ